MKPALTSLCDEDKRVDKNGEVKGSTDERLIFKDVESFDSLRSIKRQK